MVLLVGHENVADEGTLTGQERDGQLDGLTVPILTVLPVELDAPDSLIQLVQEAELSPHAEVRHGKEAQLLEDKLARELNLNCSR